jgi:hypothetical protein
VENWAVSDGCLLEYGEFVGGGRGVDIICAKIGKEVQALLQLLCLLHLNCQFCVALYKLRLKIRILFLGVGKQIVLVHRQANGTSFGYYLPFHFSQSRCRKTLDCLFLEDYLKLSV